MVVKNNLRVLMAKHKMNIQYVSDKTGLSRKSIGKLYNGTSVQVRFDVLAKLCDLFKCDIADILYLEDEE